MYKRIILYVLVAIAIGVVSVQLQHRTAQQAQLQNHAPGVTEPASPIKPPDHLTPDRRGALAVYELERLVSGHSPKQVREQFVGGMWHVYSDSTEIGTWPEYPDFSDMVSVLEQRARALGASVGEDHEHPEITQSLAAFQPLQTLTLVDKAWAAGERGGSLHLAAAGALAQLTAQTTDLVGVADAIGARALAELALCRAAGLPGLARDETLTADRLGYGAYAWAMCDSLPADDAVRLYVRHDDEALAKLAAASNGSPESRFYLLSRTAWNHDDQGYRDCAGKYFSADSQLTIPMLSTMLALGTFRSQEASAQAVIAVIGDELHLLESGGAIAASTDTDDPGDLNVAIRQFESMMTSMKGDADGQWLDGTLLRAHYRAAFYSAMWRLGEFQRKSLSSLETTRDMAAELQNLPPGPASEFGHWYSHLADAKLGHPAPLDLKADLTSLPSFGSRMRFDTFEECGNTPIGRFNGVRPQACLLLGQLDTRPDDRAETIELIRDQIMDLVWAESLLASTAHVASPANIEVQSWWARMNDDRAALLAMLDARGTSVFQATYVADQLVELSPKDSVSNIAAYRKIMARYPQPVQSVLAFNDYCTHYLHSSALNRRALRDWLKRNPVDDGGLDRVFATLALARTYQREKRYAEALAIVAPAAESQQYGAMSATAELLDLTGKGAEAETLAAFALHRYPDSREPLVGLAKLFWKHQRYDDAAALLHDTAYPLDDAHWMTLVAPAFADCFEKQPATGMKAVESLIKAGFKSQGTVGMLAKELHKRGQSEFALQVEQRLPDGGQDGSMRLFASYEILRRGRGEDAADGWLYDQVASMSDMTSTLIDYFGFDEGLPGVVWTCDQKSDRDMNYTWLLRAAMSLRPPALDADRAKLLHEHFDEPSTDHYTTLGRYMLGLEPDSVALARCTDLHAAGEVYFYMGYRAESEYRYADAANWYLRCLATGVTRNMEYGWSLGQLTRWGASMKTLERLENEDRAAQKGPSISVLGFM